MKEKIKCTDEPMGQMKRVSDFLPSPEELALKDETVRVTIALSKTSIEFFKREAKKRGPMLEIFGLNCCSPQEILGSSGCAAWIHAPMRGSIEMTARGWTLTNRIHFLNPSGPGRPQWIG